MVIYTLNLDRSQLIVLPKKLSIYISTNTGGVCLLSCKLNTDGWYHSCYLCNFLYVNETFCVNEKWYLTVVFNVISLIINKGMLSFHIFIDHYISSCVSCLFFYWVVCLFLIDFQEHFAYYRNWLFIIRIANTLSQSICLVSLFIVSFTIQKLELFMQSNESILFFMFSACCAMLRKSLPNSKFQKKFYIPRNVLF